MFPNQGSTYCPSSCWATVLGIALLTLANCAFSANWYVNQSVSASGNGQSWSTAWKQPGNVNWASVQPGDTIWIAGGNYSSGFTMTKSGSAENYIYIKRATSGDSSATSSPGWSGGFDSQVVIGPIAGPGFYFNTPATGSYVYVDGRTANGISVRYSNDANAMLGAISFVAGGMHDLVFTNMDLAGPGGSTAFNHIGDTSVINIRPVVMGGGAVYNVTVSDTQLHGGPNLIYNLGANHHFTFRRCKMYDNGSSNTAIHANIFYMSGGNYEFTFAFCEFYNWQVEGFSIYQNNNHPYYIYGCLWHSPMTSGARCFWFASSGGTTPQGPFYIYNNTFVGVQITIGEGNASQTTSSSIARNNIYWNSTWWSGSSIANSDYNFSNGSTPGANSISSGSNPFVNLTAKDFRIVPTIGAKYPKDKGIALTSTSGQEFNLDGANVTRGADGSWDIGAYEFASNGPNTNPVISISPTSLDFGAVSNGSMTTKSITIQNIGGGTLAGSASVAFPFTIASGGSYSLAGNQSAVVTISYSPASSSDSQVVTFTGGGGATAALNGSRLAFLPGLTFESFAGTITAPFVTNNGGFMSQPVETTVASGGQAVYGFTIPSTGNYVVSVNINAPSDAANSIYLNIDSQPSDPDMIWDIPITTGFQARVASWRGVGAFDNPQFNPAVFNLTAGVHQLILRGREGGVQIGRITISPYSMVTPPQNLHVVSGF